jgi:hypothetical protein
MRHPERRRDPLELSRNKRSVTVQHRSRLSRAYRHSFFLKGVNIARIQIDRSGQIVIMLVAET